MTTDNIPPFKFCEDCGEERPESEFGRFTRKVKGGERRYLVAHCRFHQNIRAAKHEEKRNEAAKEERAKARAAEQERLKSENPYDTRRAHIKRLDSMWLPTSIEGKEHVQRF